MESEEDETREIESDKGVFYGDLSERTINRKFHRENRKRFLPTQLSQHTVGFYFNITISIPYAQINISALKCQQKSVSTSQKIVLEEIREYFTPVKRDFYEQRASLFSIRLVRPTETSKWKTKHPLGVQSTVNSDERIEAIGKI